jgi:hypothetical protein
MGNDFKKKWNAFVAKHGKKVVVGWNILLVLCAITLILYYGLTSGWESVWLWFTTSRYAIYCYLGAIAYVFFMVEFNRYVKVQEAIGNNDK